MKRLASLMVIILLMFGLVISPAFGAVTTSSAGSTGFGVQTYTVTNRADGGLGVSTETSISVATIVPGKHLILGYCITPIEDSWDGRGALVDSLARTVAAGYGNDSYIIDESEATATRDGGKIFPKGGVSLRRGLTVRNGIGTSITIYYYKARK